MDTSIVDFGNSPSTDLSVSTVGEFSLAISTAGDLKRREFSEIFRRRVDRGIRVVRQRGVAASQ